MTPEEKAVLKAAKRLVAAMGQDNESRLLIAEADLRLAVQALKVSAQPEHTVIAIPCGEPSSTGAMHCELPAGHDPDETLRWTRFGVTDGGGSWEYAYRPHAGRAKNGSERRWDTWVERLVK